MPTPTNSPQKAHPQYQENFLGEVNIPGANLDLVRDSTFNPSDFNSSDFNSSDFNSSDFNSSDFNSFDFNPSDFNPSDFNQGAVHGWQPAINPSALNTVQTGDSTLLRRDTIDMQGRMEAYLSL
jgi:hypothetical protein